MATYQKLKSGEWGVRVQGTARAGDAISVRTKAGKVKTETVKAVVWSGDGVTLCSIEQAERSASSGRSATERRYMNRYGWDGARGSSSYYSSGMYDEES